MLAGDPDDPDNNGFADYCLAGDTEVYAAGGGSVSIKTLVDNKQAMMIIAHTANDSVPQRITQWHDNGKQECFTYTMADGDTVTCTPNHQFMTVEGTWIDIETALQEGTELQKS